MAQPPLHLSRLRYDDASDPRHAAVTLLHQAGVIQGDRYALMITAEAGTRATLSTAAATQVFRAPDQGAEQLMQLDIASNASFRYLPEPVILCAGADFQQTTNVRLAVTAHLVLLEVIVPGRLQRGEVGRFRRFRNALTITANDGRLLAAERADLQPVGSEWYDTGCAEAPVVGTVYLLGQDYPPLLLALRREFSDALLGIDVLPNHAGLVIRMLGSSGSTVRGTLLSIIAGVARYVVP